MNSPSQPLIMQASAVAIEGRAVLIEGEPGSGKSSLALALIDRSAQLIGDDGVSLSEDSGAVFASPPPNIAGKLEIRGVGIVELPPVSRVPVALILTLGQEGERLPEEAAARSILGVEIPCLPFTPGHIAPAARAEYALRVHGLPID